MINLAKLESLYIKNLALVNTNWQCLIQEFTCCKSTLAIYIQHWLHMWLYRSVSYLLFQSSNLLLLRTNVNRYEDIIKMFCDRLFFVLFCSNHIVGVMVSVLALSVIYRGFVPWSGQTKDYNYWVLLLLRYAHSIKEKEQRLVGSESGQCVQVGRNVYPHCCFWELAL
jgi:hypothetical protein